MDSGTVQAGVRSKGVLWLGSGFPGDTKLFITAGGETGVIYVVYAVTLATIVGTVANSFGKRWCFWVWMCTNGFWCVYNVLIGQYAQGLLYALNFAMAIVGLVKWKGNGKVE